MSDINITITAEDIQTGIWCGGCLLPSRFRFLVVGRHDDGSISFTKTEEFCVDELEANNV